MRLKKLPLAVLSTAMVSVLLAGCGGAEVVKQPDAPAKVLVNEDNTKNASNNDSKEEPEQEKKENEDGIIQRDIHKIDVQGIQEADTTIDYYKKYMKEHGYPKPYREIPVILTEGEQVNGLVYKIEDGFAMFQYKVKSKDIVYVYAVDTEKEIDIQEMKSEVILAQEKYEHEKDPVKKKAMEEPLKEQWKKISEIEASLQK